MANPEDKPKGKTPVAKPEATPADDQTKTASIQPPQVSGGFPASHQPSPPREGTATHIEDGE